MEDLTLVVGAAVLLQALQTIQTAINARNVRRDLRQLEQSLRPPPPSVDESLLRELERSLELRKRRREP